ncbi:hypothetical protein EJ08DRAFT_683623 [Tothia fuscella]|uniref:Uncharacterized protein n=1 Tax=Tothia fuscella TaxID=1048955 RepID=A0A9P4TTD7_9PEZI|nr:hypothetical protein EJ08DRAFT_683623 [Tothia fuscella]
MKRKIKMQKSSLEKRATTFACSSSQTCLLYTDGDLMCLNAATGNYIDDAGGNGNANTGVYTYADGFVTTVLAGQTAASHSLTATRTKTGSTAIASAKSSTASMTGTSSGAGTSSQGGSSSETAAASAARATSTGSGPEKIGARAVLGVVGLALGMVV